MRRPLSYSQISTWLRCPKLYEFRYVLKAEPEKVGIALLLGGAVHDAIGSEAQRRLEGKEGGLEYALTAFRQMLTCKVELPEAPVDLGDKGLIEHMEVGEGLIKANFEHGPVENLLAVEKEFELDLGEGLKLEGVIDFVVEGADGPEVVELKTAARSWSQLQAELSPQGSIYAMALGEGKREVPVTYRVLVKTKTPKVQELRLVHPPEESGRISEVAQAVRRNLETGAFPRNEGVQTCSGCSYRRQCQGKGALAA